MIIYLSGADTFRSRERLHQLRNAFIKKYDPSGMNVVSLEGASLKFEKFQQCVSSQGFLSSRRLVIIDRPFEADRKTQESIAEFITSKSVPDDTIVVFIGDDVIQKKRTKDAEGASPLASVLQHSKNREMFDALGPADAERWIIKRVKERGGSIDQAAAERLASIISSDLWLATNEIDKLVNQKRSAPITVGNVENDISEKIEANIFEFTDALSKKNARAALASLERHFASGANELYLLTMIARQIRILLSIADIAKSEPNPSTIAARLSLHPYVVKKSLEQIRTFSRSELLRAHDEIVEIDHRLKNSRDNPRALLELFVLRMCGD
ncbi:MAG: DNA polymerase III subunit delta [Candidatus Kerfeldbacteria bacterium]